MWRCGRQNAFLLLHFTPIHPQGYVFTQDIAWEVKRIGGHGHRGRRGHIFGVFHGIKSRSGPQNADCLNFVQNLAPTGHFLRRGREAAIVASAASTAGWSVRNLHGCLIVCQGVLIRGRAMRPFGRAASEAAFGRGRVQYRHCVPSGAFSGWPPSAMVM